MPGALAGGAAPGAARRPAGLRARVCAGDGPRAGHKREWTRGGGGRGAAAPPKGPRPPSGLYVSAPGGAASARRPGPPLPPPGRRAGEPCGGEGSRGLP
ncbi:uncharacterized protein LOC114672650 isoform X2 [Macaca mulatta]